MPLDDADKKFIADLLADSQKKAEEAAKREVQTAVKGLKVDETVAAALAKAEEARAAKAAEEAAAKGGKADEPAAGANNVELKRTQDELKKIQEQLAREKAARETAEADAKTDRLLNAARDALVKAGVPADRVRHALATLHNADGRLKYDDKGVPGLHFQRDGYEEVVPLAKGIAEWAKTEDGKLFQAPTEARGGTDNENRKPATILRTVEGGKREIDMESIAGKLLGALRAR